MPNSFICATCRLKTVVSHLRKERLSGTLHITESSHSQCSAGIWQSHATTRVDGRRQSTRKYSSEVGPIGRYSRRSLRPQEILEQLGHTGQEIKGRTDVRHQQPRNAKSNVRRASATNVSSAPTLSDRLTIIISTLDKAHARKDVSAVLNSLRSLGILQRSDTTNNTDRDGIARYLDPRKKISIIETAVQVRADWRASANEENEPPTMSTILRALQELEALDRVTLLRTLRTLAHTIAAGRIRRLKQVTQRDVTIYPPVSSDCEAEFLSDLVEMWRQYIYARVSVAKTKSSSRLDDDQGESVDLKYKVSGTDTYEDWTFLPDVTTLKGLPRDEKLTTLKALSVLFGERNVHKTSVRETLLVTYELLTQDTPEASPQILKKVDSPTRHLSCFFESIVKLPGGFGELDFGKTPRTDSCFEEYLQAMAARLGITLPEKPERIQSKGERPHRRLTEPLPGIDGNQHDELVKRIGRAVERSDNSALERLFELFKQKQPDITGEKPSMLRYEGLILAFLTLRHPSRAVEVWNLMLKAGLSPTIRTWTIMLNGCQRANDTNAMEGFWRRMRMDGFQPDRHAWSTRILGLLSGRRIEQGLAALTEMGQEWVNAAKTAKFESLKASAIGSGKKEKLPMIAQIQISADEYQGDVNGVPRPDIVVMNTAVSALATKDDKHIYKVLQWGQAFGIEPDVQTYNALLNVTMRHGNAEEAISILQRMQQKGHGLNSSTFTVILTALFESDEFLKGVPIKEQEQEVMNVILGLESVSNAKVDAKGYAVILDRLLKQHKNPEACRVVMAYMQDQGIAPTTHIYTILMAHYFSCDPPQLEAIDSLWAHIKSTNRGYGTALDNIFYDRMVEGYATHHRIVGVGPMFRCLQEMSAQGKTPSWYVLRLIAQALAEREEWARLEQIVHDIRQQGKGGKGGLKMKGMAGQRDFWSFIISTGVLEKEGITHPSQVEVFRDDNFSAAAGKAEITASRAARGFHV